MARIIFFGLMFFGISLFAQTPELWGRWQFVSYIYQGTEHPLPNPRLQLTFEFNPDGTNWIRWTRDQEPGFCERQARYEIIDGTLLQEIIWVNPNNNRDCGSDPDMQMGRKTQNAFRIKDDRLQTDLLMAGDVLTYVWIRK